ncbi:MAG: CHRD domain-containing protein [Actinomycetota bacterium]|nr:CHRD domain-containing protein [Actinomycetota bacterium]
MLGRFGACLAALSSLLVVAALPSTASAQDDPQPQGPGHYMIQLTPEEVTGGGNQGASGSARVDFDVAHNTVCYALSWKDLRGDVTMAHIHVAPPGQDGPHPIDFFNDQHFPGAGSTASGCSTSTPDKMKAVIDHPAGYYVIIHTTAFPDGAIRGQLG